MSLVFVLQMYLIASSNGKNWGIIDIYNRMVIPNKVYRTENSSVTIYCGSSSPVSWMYLPVIPSNGVQVPDFRRHTTGMKQITLNKLLWTDSGIYYCKGTHEGQAFIVHTVVLVHNGIPKKKVVPNWVEVSEGSSVALTCGSYSPVEWFSLNFRSQNKIIRYNTLTLYNLKKKHSGRYICRGKSNKVRLRGVRIRRHYYSVFHSEALVIVEGVVRRVNTLKPGNNQ